MTKIAIIGSGPAALTAAIYTARAGLEPEVFASSVEPGGELMKTTEVENFPGFPEGIMGPDLMEKIQQQAERFGAKIRYEDVTKLELEGNVKRVHSGSGEILETQAVIFATGSEYRKLGVPGEVELSGHGVSYCATCDGFFFRDQEIAVVGGGDSAMEEAIFLSKFASKVYLIHRSENFRASKIMLERAQENEKIEFITNSSITQINGETNVTSVTLINNVSRETSELALTGVFVAIGTDPRTHLVHGQLDLTPEGVVAVNGRTSKTNIPGVFAAGDVIDSNYRQAVMAAGSGCAAAMDAEVYLENLH